MGYSGWSRNGETQIQILTQVWSLLGDLRPVILNLTYLLVFWGYRGEGSTLATALNSLTGGWDKNVKIYKWKLYDVSLKEMGRHGERLFSSETRDKKVDARWWDLSEKGTEEIATTPSQTSLVPSKCICALIAFSWIPSVTSIERAISPFHARSLS